MEHDFWHKRWAEQRIGFHQETVNKLLEKYFSVLDLALGAQVFVPLSGKSTDMLWLREQGCGVLGVELSDTACDAFFNENGQKVEGSAVGDFYVRSFDQVALLCGDFFQLTSRQLNQVTAVYDRAALIALPAEMREAYAKKMMGLLPRGVKILLITLEFEGKEGPPFSVSSNEVFALFSERFAIEQLVVERPSDGRDAGRSEVVWLLSDRANEL